MYKKIIWEVIHGEKLGRKLGFPTANVSYTYNDIENSVFLLNVVIDNTIYAWMGSHMVAKWVFEAHIFDFDMDIYGKNIEIILLQKLRDNKKFDSLEELVSQIKKDKIVCEATEIKVLTFWSFDLVHEWHHHYLFESKKYGNHLTTVVASDENILKIKWNAPVHNVQERVNAISEIWLCNRVIAWSKNAPMQWIEKIKPDIICLWYDQRWPFVDLIENEIKKQWLQTSIVRIDALQPDIYKSSLLKKKSS